MKDGATTRQDIAFQNALPASDIEELIGLTKGYLGTDDADDGESDGPAIFQFPSAG